MKFVPTKPWWKSEFQLDKGEEKTVAFFSWIPELGCLLAPVILPIWAVRQWLRTKR